MLFSLIPPGSTFAVRAALTPAQSQPSIHFTPAAPLGAKGFAPPNRLTVAIPVALDGCEPPSRCRLELLEARVRTASLGQLQFKPSAAYQPYQTIALEAFLVPTTEPNAYQLMLSFDRSVLGRLQGSAVTITGKAGVAFYRRGQSTVMPLYFTKDVPGVGRCTSAVIQNQSSYNLLKVLCESPREFARYTKVELIARDGRRWHHYLGESTTFVNGPRQTWLSPLQRRTAFFQLTDQDIQPPGGQYLTSRNVLADAQLAISAEPAIGYGTADFESKDISLSNFVVQPRSQ